MPDLAQARLRPIRPLAGRSRCVLRGGPEVRAGDRRRRSRRSAISLRRAAAADRFTGKSGSIARHRRARRARRAAPGRGRAPARNASSRIATSSSSAAPPWARFRAPPAQATIFAEFGAGPLKPEQVAELALGARLRAYAFDRYKTKRKEGEERADKVEVNFACANPAAAEKAWARAPAIADGVVLARDLVNEPANVLYPGEFARRASGAEEARRRGRGARRRRR